jgi:class 3 adenylate cyclase
MGRSWAASLLIGVLVSAALLALYHFGGVFFKGAVHLEAFYHSIFVLPTKGELDFILPLQYGFFTVLAFLSAWICMELPRWFSRIAYLAGAVFLTLLLSPVLSFCGVLFEPFSGAGAILLSGLCGFIHGSSAKAQRAHEYLHRFTGRISTEKYQQLISAKKPVELSGKRDLTVMTCRILNYPELGSEMEAADLEKMGTLFLQAAAEFLVGKGAYLDSCNAEGVRVFFGMLDHEETHARDACHAALELRQRLVNLEQQMEHRWHRKPVFGVALASGPMSLGLFGFREFQFYSAVGESLDFSRRLCSVNLVYGTHVLIAARTYTLTKELMEVRPMEMVYAPRMHQISEVYELLAEKGSLSDEEMKSRDAFWQGVVSLRKGDYKEAVQMLKKAGMEGRDDAPQKYFLERAEAAQRDDKSPGESKETRSTVGTAKHVRVLTAN